jgi:hypothetical protein
MKVKYISLSTSTMTLLLLQVNNKEICVELKLPFNAKSSISTVWKFNGACHISATTHPPPLTPCSRSTAVKHHWFCEHMQTS